MRTITTHHTNECNRAIRVLADDRDERAGNSSHCYQCEVDNDPSAVVIINFQRGPIKEAGINGITNEVLLAIVIDRLEGFQSSKFACKENERALEHCRESLAYLEERTKNRELRGVEGTNKL